MVSAPSSASGKTVFTCALIRLLERSGLRPAAFKCGPDYIDQRFHRRVSGVAAGNLDAFFSSAADLRALLARGAAGSDIAVIEGAMGFYDGMAPGTTDASAYDVARLTDTPVVLVVSARGASLSLAALVDGFARFRSDACVRGVVLNGCSEAAYRYAAGAIEDETGVPVLGYLPQDDRFQLESRHLGLVGADEVEDLRGRVDAMADVLEETLDVKRLVDVARSAAPVTAAPYRTERLPYEGLRCAVADDEAFCFRYAENLRMLEDLGVELVSFSPLRDEKLPAGVTGLYLAGGYPELHAQELSDNEGMRAAVRAAVKAGMPTVAECGGYLYLLESLDDDRGTSWPMAGVLPGGAYRGRGFGHFGYIELTMACAGPYGPAGTVLRGHEFHYWRAEREGDSAWAAKPRRNRGWACMDVTPTLAAGFPHVYYPSNPDAARAFVRAQARYREEGGRCGS
ncbi:cobyrinic acid a,c-diamide synthase [Collinsella sp. An2]|nr:cobyrinic acid a,c-diamide synthase [Collinsella sp. An2]